MRGSSVQLRAKRAAGAATLIGTGLAGKAPSWIHAIAHLGDAIFQPFHRGATFAAAGAAVARQTAKYNDLAALPARTPVVSCWFCADAARQCCLPDAEAEPTETLDADARFLGPLAVRCGREFRYASMVAVRRARSLGPTCDAARLGGELAVGVLLQEVRVRLSGVGRLCGMPVLLLTAAAGGQGRQ
jgi:hypothetical protein